MKSIFEEMGGTYRQVGDYLIPNLVLPDDGDYQIGKYGRMRRSYLKEHPDAELEAAFSVPDSVDEYAVPVKKGETELLDAIQTAIDELKADGTLSKLSENYFDADFTEAPDSES